MSTVGLRVVGGAILRDGHLLAACRARPPRWAGYWEFPGGKVEPGETARAALRRELREELGVAVRVGARVGPAVTIADGAGSLVVFAVRLRPPHAQPQPREHAELRWVDPAQAAGLGWLPVDLPIVRAVLGARALWV